MHSIFYVQPRFRELLSIVNREPLRSNKGHAVSSHVRFKSGVIFKGFITDGAFSRSAAIGGSHATGRGSTRRFLGAVPCRLPVERSRNFGHATQVRVEIPNLVSYYQMTPQRRLGGETSAAIGALYRIFLSLVADDMSHEGCLFRKRMQVDKLGEKKAGYR